MFQTMIRKGFLLAAKMKDGRELLKVLKSSLHTSIPRIPLALPWHRNDTENENAVYSAYEVVLNIFARMSNKLFQVV